jgi:hypothetical protein
MFLKQENKRFLYVSKTLSRNPQDSAVFLKQFHCDTQRTPTSNKVDVFGTGISLPGRADLYQAQNGTC